MLYKRVNYRNSFIVLMTILDLDFLTAKGAKYLQVANAISNAITHGQLKSEAKLPPQRILAYKLKVTVGTITRAYKELERRGCVITKVGSGTFVKPMTPHPALLSTVNHAQFDLRSANAPNINQLTLLQQGLIDIANDPTTLLQCLNYQPEIAFSSQRQRLACWLELQKIHCQEQQVLFTYGGQHAVTLTLQTLCRAGDTVLCEGLTFAGFSATCQILQLKVIGLAMDHEGVTIDALTSAIKQSHPRVLYLTPQVQNPTCSQLTFERRLQIVALCQRHNITIIEDDVQFLPAKLKQPPFYQLAPELTVYISSFSKSFSGGLRIGFLVTTPELREKMRLTLKANCWTLPPLQIELFCRWLEQGKIDELANAIEQEMTVRHQIAKEILADYQITTQIGGYNLWLTLPTHWRAVDFERFAEKNHVLVRAAESFAIGRFNAPQAIRISLCAAQNHDVLHQSLNALKACLSSSISHQDVVI